MHPIYKPYSETFSKTSMTQSISDNHFPVGKRESATDCNASKWLQKGSRTPYIHNGEDEEVVEKKNRLTAHEVEELSSADGIVKLNRKGIELAVERRVSLFFQQAIMCYNMSNFQFLARGADDQIGTSPKIKFSAVSGENVVHKREAAHSSTIPTLIAKEKNGAKREFVYLKGGSYHAQHNATIGMHECVNGADELIDGKPNENKLRASAVRILNLVANGLDPAEATRKFLDAFEKEANDVKKALKPEDSRGGVLDAYSAEIAAIQNVAKEKGFFDHLMGVQVSQSDQLRKTVYQKRFELIRLQEVIESRIGKRIQTLVETMKKEGAFLELILVKEFSSTKLKNVVSKLFNKTAHVFDESYMQPKPAALKSFQTRVNTIREKHKAAIANLKVAMLADFSELDAAEITYRAGLFRDIRNKVKGWTQSKFCAEYRKANGTSVSVSWVSRMENLSRESAKARYITPVSQRRRIMKVDEAEACAKTFGVDAALFLPALFTSNY